MRTIKFRNLKENLEKIYLFMDEEIKKFNGNIICQKGCSGCCSKTECYAYPLEAAYATVFLNKNFNFKVKSEIAQKIKLYDNLYNVKIKEKGSRFFSAKNLESLNNLYSNISQLNIQCPFLSDEHSCVIYPVRPHICRAFISYSKEECIGQSNPSVMQQEKFLEFFNKIRNELISLNKLFFITIGMDPINVTCIPLPRLIDFRNDNFVFIGAGKKEYLIIA